MQDDIHWAEFETAFTDRFTDLHKVTKATTELQNLRMRTGDLGPIWLSGFGFAYCLVLVSEFSGSHYCDRVSNVM